VTIRLAGLLQLPDPALFGVQVQLGSDLVICACSTPNAVSGKVFPIRAIPVSRLEITNSLPDIAKSASQITKSVPEIAKSDSQITKLVSDIAKSDSDFAISLVKIPCFSSIFSCFLASCGVNDIVEWSKNDSLPCIVPGRDYCASLPISSDVIGRKTLPGDKAADVNPLNIPARGKFEPTHVGCYDEIGGVRRARTFAFWQRANVAQTSGHDAAGTGEISRLSMGLQPTQG